jgi:hypothetical protein
VHAQRRVDRNVEAGFEALEVLGQALTHRALLGADRRRKLDCLLIGGVVGDVPQQLVGGQLEVSVRTRRRAFEPTQPGSRASTW